MDTAFERTLARRHASGAISSRLTIIACLLLLPMLGWASRPLPPTPPEPSGSRTEPMAYLTHGVRVFDGEASHDGLDAHIADRLIRRSGPAVDVPPEVERIDGGGHALLPGSGNAPPAMQRFRAGPEWRDHAFELSAFAGADLTRLRAIAIVALGPAGEFELLIDDVELQ